jgi:hypothetical protein
MTNQDSSQLDPKELRRTLAAQRRYIEELEKQLEPNVIAEIRDYLSHGDSPNELEILLGLPILRMIAKEDAERASRQEEEPKP